MNTVVIIYGYGELYLFVGNLTPTRKQELVKESQGSIFEVNYLLKRMKDWGMRYLIDSVVDMESHSTIIRFKKGPNKLDVNFYSLAKDRL